jgi:hypothetical protein
MPVLRIALRHVQRREALARAPGRWTMRSSNHCADDDRSTPRLAHLRWLSLRRARSSCRALLDQVLERRETRAGRASPHWDVERLDLADDREREGEYEVRDGLRAARLRRLAAGQGADLRQAAGGEQALRPEEEAEAVHVPGHERLLRGHADDGAHSMLRTPPADLADVRTPWSRRPAPRARAVRCRAARGLSRWRLAAHARSYLGRKRGPRAAARTAAWPWKPGTTPSRSVPRLAVVVDVGVDRRACCSSASGARSWRSRAGCRRPGASSRWRRSPCASSASFEPGRADFTRLAAAGDGGTDFTPLLQAAEALRPDLIVVLTDLDGRARHRPACPVLWAVPEVSAGAASAARTLRAAAGAGLKAAGWVGEVDGGRPADGRWRQAAATVVQQPPSAVELAQRGVQPGQRRGELRAQRVRRVEHVHAAAGDAEAARASGCWSVSRARSQPSGARACSRRGSSRAAATRADLRVPRHVRAFGKRARAPRAAWPARCACSRARARSSGP